MTVLAEYLGLMLLDLITGLMQGMPSWDITCSYVGYLLCILSIEPDGSHTIEIIAPRVFRQLSLS